MLSKDKETMLLRIFLEADDFCLALLKRQAADRLGTPPHPTRQKCLSASEVMTILVFYHCSGYKCFEYYYRQYVLDELRSYFPHAPSYQRFIEYLPWVWPGLYLFMQQRCEQAQATGIYYIDSKKLPVCDNHRIHQHRVFAQVAQRGRSSTGWFYGLKLHLVINSSGEVVHFQFTPANTADNNLTLLERLLAGLQGCCFGDKGYLTSAFAAFYERGLRLVTKVRRNRAADRMKAQLLPWQERCLLAKRAVIESVNDLLTSVFDLEHTRHRSPINALAHMVSALLAYSFYPDKPSINLPQLI